MIRRFPVPPEFIERMLDPYLPGRHYLQSAVIESVAGGGRFPEEQGGGLVRAVGQFKGAPEPWYIRDTGHFNSIEANLCLNQLGYVLIGQCTGGNLPAVPELAAMSREEYYEQQLPGVFIATITMRFARPMITDAFEGVLTIDEATLTPGGVGLQLRFQFMRDGVIGGQGTSTSFVMAKSEPD